MRDLSATRWTLVQAAGAGDEEAWSALVDKYRPTLTAYFVRRSQLGEAEDLAQEVFTRVVEGKILARAGPSDGTLRCLLSAICRNVLGNHLERRQAKKRGGGAVRSLGDHEIAVLGEEPEFDLEWLTGLLDLALQRLAREHVNYHQALGLQFLEGKTQEEIAQLLSRSRKTVKNHVHRGRNKLVGFLLDEIRAYTTSPAAYRREFEYIRSLLPR